MILNGDVVRTIEHFARLAYPDECCGAVMGIDDVAMAVLPLPNQAQDRRRRFTIVPDDYRYAEDVAETAGASLLGFYHSHPDAPARPSAVDLAQASPNLIYVIIAVESEGIGELTAWRLAEDRSCFEKEALSIDAHRKVS